MLVLEGGAEELEAELEWGVELPNQLLDTLVISNVHVLDMVTVGWSRTNSGSTLEKNLQFYLKRARKSNEITIE